jgi:hypothetical protein
LRTLLGPETVSAQIIAVRPTRAVQVKLISKLMAVIAPMV